MTKQGGYVFISYAASDQDDAKRIAEALESAGLKTWMADDIVLGDDWQATIDEAVKAASSGVVVLSPSSVRSAWVTSEYRTMLSQNKRLYPIVIRPIDTDDIPPRLKDLLWIDLTNDFDSGMARLVGAIQRGVTGDQDFSQPSPKHSRVAVKLEINPADFDAEELKKIVTTLADAGVENIKIVESKDG
jgi:hypothetical protein